MNTSKNWNSEALKSAPQLLFNCNFDCNCNNVLQRKNQRFLPTDVSMVTRYYNQTIKKTLIKQRRYFFFRKKFVANFLVRLKMIWMSLNCVSVSRLNDHFYDLFWITKVKTVFTLAKFFWVKMSSTQWLYILIDF